MDPHQFLARLCALIPPPGFHMTRYYGELASHHRLREHVIPKPAAPPPPPQLALDFALSSDPAESSPRPRRIGWAKLLTRVFALDITTCRKCGGRMRVLEVVDDPDHIARLLGAALTAVPCRRTRVARSRGRQVMALARCASVAGWPSSARTPPEARRGRGRDGGGCAAAGDVYRRRMAPTHPGLARHQNPCSRFAALLAAKIQTFTWHDEH
jgi:hypothetical protein